MKGRIGLSPGVHDLDTSKSLLEGNDRRRVGVQDFSMFGGDIPRSHSQVREAIDPFLTNVIIVDVFGRDSATHLRVFESEVVPPVSMEVDLVVSFGVATFIADLYYHGIAFSPLMPSEIDLVNGCPREENHLSEFLRIDAVLLYLLKAIESFVESIHLVTKACPIS
jgi:hypothetical protein